MEKAIDATRVEKPSRFCPHVTLVAIVTPTVWIALLYMLMVR